MRDYGNRLDWIGIVGMGIDFETKEELDRFVLIVRDELESRVGKIMCEVMDSEQVEEFEKLSEEGITDFREWLNINCPEYGTICKTATRQLKSEIKEHRDKIAGRKHNAYLDVCAMVLEQLPGLSSEEINAFKNAGIETIGEVDYLSELQILKITNCGSKRVEGIQNLISDFVVEMSENESGK